jgi:hypothetical protein
MSDGDSTSDRFKLKMRQLHQVLSPRSQPQVISALTYDSAAKKEQELTPGSEWFVEVMHYTTVYLIKHHVRLFGRKEKSNDESIQVWTKKQQ